MSGRRKRFRIRIRKELGSPMPNLCITGKIVCPYFHRVASNGRAIVCEGLVPGSEIANCFRASGDLSDWAGKVCQTHQYAKRCMVAEAIERNYSEDI